jgi:hypothetical protein
MKSVEALVLVAVAAAAGCRPSLDDRPWLVTTLQILGVKADPPEVAPGGAVTMEVVALDPTSAVDPSATAWTLCRAPKPLGESRVVAPDCLMPAAADVVGSPATLTIPPDACQVFGPNTPQPAPGAPPTRPRDPDATGGYFQPATVVLDGAIAVALERVTCGLPDASLDVVRAYQAAYRPNQNPIIAAITLTVDGAAADPSSIAPGARVAVAVSWAPGSAETFPVFDRASSTLVDTTEVLSASWYVTAGDLDRAVAEVVDPGLLSAATTWTVPGVVTTAQILVVLRDSRGGVDSARATINVR